MLKLGLHFQVILNLKFDVAKDNNNINLLIFYSLPQGNLFHRERYKHSFNTDCSTCST